MTRILLVEDDRNTCVLLEHVLHSAGYAVDFVSSVAEAERRLAETSYDLVIPSGGSAMVMALRLPTRPLPAASRPPS
jgi:CheY-like chemotaxis protein